MPWGDVKIDAGRRPDRQCWHFGACKLPWGLQRCENCCFTSPCRAVPATCSVHVCL